MRISLILLATLLLSACSQARFSHTFNYGQAGRITCYSGGHKVFDDFSTGRIENEANSDGYYFVSTTTGRVTSTSGDCTIDYGASRTSDFQAVHHPEM